MKKLTSDKIIFGFESTTLTSNEYELFKKFPPRGFILFKRNIESSLQLDKLIKNLRDINSQNKLVILIDQEGGRVARIKPPIAYQEFPPAAFFGEIYKKDPIEAKELVYKNYFALMSELKSFGIDSPCAPVADLYHRRANDVIGDRSFSDEIEIVNELSAQSIRAIIAAGGIPIIKHIPGHGRASVDSHYALPIITTKLDELVQTDFVPFKYLSKINNIDQKQIWSMTAHLIIEELDTNLPVTLSAKTIKYIRNEIGFKGTIVSDDICMKALHAGLSEFSGPIYNKSLIDSAHKAYLAGCDYILHCSGNIEEMSSILSSIE